MSKTLGIVGGMGPLATVDLFKKIVMLTDARCDQEHLHVMVDNNTEIPDRTAYLMGKGEDPKQKLIETARRLELLGADYLIMPCNTAHYFYDDIVKKIDIDFLNMIEETAKHLIRDCGQTGRVGLLATEGTCRSGVYDKVFQRFGIEVVKPDNDLQQHVTDLIYGIKKGQLDMDLKGFYQAVEQLVTQSCDVCILGCTELSVADDLFKLKGNYVDPLEIVAISAIKYAGLSPKTNVEEE